MLEAIRIANVADVFDLNVSPHSFTGHLCTMIHAHYSAIVPNFQIMEFDVDEVPWLAEFFTEPLQIENGDLIIGERPGWGMDIDEDAVRARPAR